MNHSHSSYILLLFNLLKYLVWTWEVYVILRKNGKWTPNHLGDETLSQRINEINYTHLICKYHIYHSLDITLPHKHKWVGISSLVRCYAIVSDILSESYSIQSDQNRPSNSINLNALPIKMHNYRNISRKIRYRISVKAFLHELSANMRVLYHISIHPSWLSTLTLWLRSDVIRSIRIYVESYRVFKQSIGNTFAKRNYYRRLPLMIEYFTISALWIIQ